jgi:uncharacterized repeat protein (TIGR03803 family)
MLSAYLQQVAITMTFTRILGIMICCCSLIQSYASYTFTDIHDFGSGSDGDLPQGTPFQASNGLIYGMTTNGGGSGIGMIFSFDPTNVAGTYTDIHDFIGSPSDGSFPEYSAPFQASSGLIYGMTKLDGANNEGIIFSFDPTNVGGTYTDIHDFSGFAADGSFPEGSLFQATNGLIYGLTFSGGVNNEGIIFSYDPVGIVYTVVHVFGSGSDGSFPEGSLFQATNGLIYGMTDAGGASGPGMIFSYDPMLGIYTDVHDFSGSPSDGANPHGSLIQASNGLIYGMTSAGGASGNGMIFSYDPMLGIYTNIHDFSGNPFDGANPHGSLIQASNGLIYGMTSAGGMNNLGMIFSFDPANVAGTYTDIYDFSGGPSDGATPLGSLIQASNGLFYGMTSAGGASGNGIIFSLSISPSPSSPSLERAFRRSSAPGGYRSRGR